MRIPVRLAYRQEVNVGEGRLDIPLPNVEAVVCDVGLELHKALGERRRCYRHGFTPVS
jgi:hypothetical protein